MERSDILAAIGDLKLYSMRGAYDGIIATAVTRAGRRDRIADHLSRLDFVVFDELGYLPFARAGGQLLFWSCPVSADSYGPTD